MPNQETLLPYALTTLDRVKDKLGLTKPDNDIVMTRVINSVTDYIENDCNRRFLSTVRINEKHSIIGRTQTHLFLQQAPVTAIANIQYRQGLIGSPTWTNYTINDYEISGNGVSGIVNFYTYLNLGLPQGNNMVQASYTAGYLIDFKNMGDTSKHNLPNDLSELADRMAIKWFKKREHTGKTTEKFDRDFITWSTELDSDDKVVLASYRRLTIFF